MNNIITKKEYIYIKNNITKESTKKLIKNKCLSSIDYDENNLEINIKGKKIFFISDIHSDFPRFIQILYFAKIIDFKNNIIPDEKYIKNDDIIEDVIWLNDNFYLIILGDIIDGKRINGIKEADDNIGDYELKLHIFIYNIRILSKLKNSNVIFTIGNHDYDTIRYNEIYQLNYIQNISLKFFGNETNRTEILTFFYYVNPYYFLILKNDNKKIFASHAGYEYRKNFNDLKYTEIHQNFEFWENNYNEHLKKLILDKKNIENDIKKKIYNEQIIFNRTYLNVINNLINKNIIKSKDFLLCKNNLFDIIIIGHNQVFSFKKLTNIQIVNQQYECYKKRCILPICGTLNGPKIFMIDIGLSTAFYNSNIDNDLYQFLYIDSSKQNFLDLKKYLILCNSNRYNYLIGSNTLIDIKKNDFLFPELINNYHQKGGFYKYLKYKKKYYNIKNHN